LLQVRLGHVGDADAKLGGHREDPADVALRIDHDRDLAVVQQVGPVTERRRFHHRGAESREARSSRSYPILHMGVTDIARPGRACRPEPRDNPYDGRVTDEATPDQLRQELRDIDAELAELRRVTSDVQSRRGEDGDESEGFEEPEDIATELTGLAETEAVIDTLESRREAVEARLHALE
jgi:hypothetical protein